MAHMDKKIIGLIISILTLNVSCTKDLKEKERSWNPYVLNEILVFESSEKELDTITINKVIDNAISSGPTPELYRHTYLTVYGKKLKLKNNIFSTKGILNISSSTPNRPAEIGFELYFKNARFGSWYKLEELNKYPTMSVTTKAGTFNDVIKLEPEIYYSKREDEVQFMYWSKKHGYIKFERTDGLTWELIKKYVP